MRVNGTVNVVVTTISRDEHVIQYITILHNYEKRWYLFLLFLSFTKITYYKLIYIFKNKKKLYS